jgi:hypothetical protein
MTKYTLKFRYAHETRYLYLPLSSETLEEAIQETKYFIEDLENIVYTDLKTRKEKYKVVEAYIEKHIESKEIVWGLENGN